MENTGTLGRIKGLSRIAPTYCFMYLLGPVVWQLWMVFRLRFLSFDESRRCLLSPLTISLAIILFALNMASLAGGTGRIGAGKRVTVPRRMAVHCASLLFFATIGTAAAMSALADSDAARLLMPLRLIIGSLNGASMCFMFYAASTASVLARLSPQGMGSGEGERRIFGRIRAFNAVLFALGLPAFIATSLAAASMAIASTKAGNESLLLLSMTIPVAMGGALLIKSDRRLAALQRPGRKEPAR